MSISIRVSENFTPRIRLTQSTSSPKKTIANPGYGEPYEQATISSSRSENGGFSNNFGEPHMPAPRFSRAKPQALNSPERHIKLVETKSERPAPNAAKKEEVPPSGGAELNPLAGEPYQPTYLIADSRVSEAQIYQGYS